MIADLSSRPSPDTYAHPPQWYPLPRTIVPERLPADLGAWANPPQRFIELADRWIHACEQAWLTATGRVGNDARAASAPSQPPIHHGLVRA